MKYRVKIRAKMVGVAFVTAETLEGAQIKAERLTDVDVEWAWIDLMEIDDIEEEVNTSGA